MTTQFDSSPCSPLSLSEVHRRRATRSATDLAGWIDADGAPEGDRPSDRAEEVIG